MIDMHFQYILCGEVLAEDVPWHLPAKNIYLKEHRNKAEKDIDRKNRSKKNMKA